MPRDKSKDFYLRRGGVNWGGYRGSSKEDDFTVKGINRSVQTTPEKAVKKTNKFKQPDEKAFQRELDIRSNMRRRGRPGNRPAQETPIRYRYA